MIKKIISLKKSVRDSVGQPLKGTKFEYIVEESQSPSRVVHFMAWSNSPAAGNPGSSSVSGGSWPLSNTRNSSDPGTTKGVFLFSDTVFRPRGLSRARAPFLPTNIYDFWPINFIFLLNLFSIVIPHILLAYKVLCVVLFYSWNQCSYRE